MYLSNMSEAQTGNNLFRGLTFNCDLNPVTTDHFYYYELDKCYQARINSDLLCECLEYQYEFNDYYDCTNTSLDNYWFKITTNNLQNYIYTVYTDRLCVNEQFNQKWNDGCPHFIQLSECGNFSFSKIQLTSNVIKKNDFKYYHLGVILYNLIITIIMATG